MQLGDDWDLRVRNMGMIALGHHMNVCQVRVEEEDSERCD